MKAMLAAVLGVLALAAPAQASFHYSATVRFSGTFVSEEYDSGAPITRVSSRASWNVHDPGVVVTVQRGVYAMYPSGHTTARLSVDQSGYQTVCTATQQAFTDTLTRQPSLAWFSLKRTHAGGLLGFGWSGERVDRHRDAAAEGDCTDPGGTETSGGNGDEAGSRGIAGRFGVKLLLSSTKLLRGRSIVKRVSVSRTNSSLVGGFGVVETLTGNYTIVFSRVS